MYDQVLWRFGFLMMTFRYKNHLKIVDNQIVK